MKNVRDQRNEKIINQLTMDERVNLMYFGSNKEVANRLMEHPRVSVEIKEDVDLTNNNLVLVEKPDVILCERFLADGDGFSMYRELRRYPAWDSIPFILIAESYEDGLITRAMNQGIDDIYVLPLPSNEDLLSRIEFLRDFKMHKQSDKVNLDLPLQFKIPISKRLFDIIVASLALIILSPILLLVMVAIRLESKGKIYYTSLRVGQKPFNFYKFRSMRIGAEDELKKLAKQKNQYIPHEPVTDIDLKKPCPCMKRKDFVYCSPVLHSERYSICDTWYITQKIRVEKAKPPFIKIQDDPRITRVGKFIRNTSIDEIPQLINVIKGDMSIVGNRPLPLYEAEKLTTDAMAKRFLAPAGLTGLWQVERRGRKGAMSDAERKNLDLRYADLFLKNEYSFYYDLNLIMRTLPVIVQKESV
jgi:lipopolysaccharide/colanic/teichoic acid biosynthesis glycosyltransferase